MQQHTYPDIVRGVESGAVPPTPSASGVDSPPRVVLRAGAAASHLLVTPMDPADVRPLLRALAGLGSAPTRIEGVQPWLVRWGAEGWGHA